MVTINDIAGFCPEEAVWKLLQDISLYALKAGGGYTIDSSTVEVEGEQFLLTATADATTEADMVWALGALAYQTATGHEVFGGYGRQYQQAHPNVALPVLQKDFSRLTPIIHRCLAYNPDNRISLEELSRVTAKETKKASRQTINNKPAAGNAKTKVATADKGPENWPEEMIP